MNYIAVGKGLSRRLRPWLTASPNAKQFRFALGCALELKRIEKQGPNVPIAPPRGLQKMSLSQSEATLIVISGPRRRTVVAARPEGECMAAACPRAQARYSFNRKREMMKR